MRIRERGKKEKEKKKKRRRWMQSKLAERKKKERRRRKEKEERERKGSEKKPRIRIVVTVIHSAELVKETSYPNKSNSIIGLISNCFNGLSPLDMRYINNFIAFFLCDLWACKYLIIPLKNPILSILLRKLA